MSEGSLVRARAASAVAGVLDGRSLDAELPAALEGLPPRDAGLTRELASGSLRHWYSLAHAVRGKLRKPLHERDRDVLALLVVGLYQLRHLRIPDHAAVHATAGAARTLGKPWAVALANGVLRALARERAATGKRSPEVLSDHPRWLLDSLAAAWPEHWQQILRTNLERAPMALRCRPGSRDSLAAELATAGHPSTPTALAPNGLVLDEPAPVAALAAHAEGRLSVQDEGAQLAAVLVDRLAPQAGHLLDACAAPGGKAAACLEARPDLQVTAVDVDAQRSALVSAELDRLGLTAQVLTGDGRQPGAWWPGGQADVVLLDAPCSGTGTLRRHPDAKLLRRATDVPAMAQLQGELLDALWGLLGDGGALVYCTCSVLPEENDAVLQAFIARQPGARARSGTAVAALLGLPEPTAGQGGDNVIISASGVQLLPASGGHDGFFYGVLDRRTTDPQLDSA